MSNISPRRFKKGDLVYRTDQQSFPYWGIVYDFDKDNDIWIHDFSGETGSGTLLDWQNKYALLTPEKVKNVSFIQER
jgi:hypothetical protein